MAPGGARRRSDARLGRALRPRPGGGDATGRGALGGPGAKWAASTAPTATAGAARASSGALRPIHGRAARAGRPEGRRGSSARSSWVSPTAWRAGASPARRRCPSAGHRAMLAATAPCATPSCSSRSRSRAPGRRGERAEGHVRQASLVRREWLPAALLTTGVETEFDAGAERVVRAPAPHPLRPDPDCGRAARRARARARRRACSPRPRPATRRGPSPSPTRRSCACGPASPASARGGPRSSSRPSTTPRLSSSCPPSAPAAAPSPRRARAPLVDVLLGRLDARQRQALEREAPERLAAPERAHLGARVPGGRRRAAGPQLQELFGLRGHPPGWWRRAPGPHRLPCARTPGRSRPPTTCAASGRPPTPRYARNCARAIRDTRGPRIRGRQTPTHRTMRRSPADRADSRPVGSSDIL